MVDIPSPGKFENRRRPRRYTPSSNPPPNRDGRSSRRADLPQTSSSETSSLGWVLAGLGLVLALLWPSS